MGMGSNMNADTMGEADVTVTGDSSRMGSLVSFAAARRAFSILLAVALTMGLMPQGAFADAVSSSSSPATVEQTTPASPQAESPVSEQPAPAAESVASGSAAPATCESVAEKGSTQDGAGAPASPAAAPASSSSPVITTQGTGTPSLSIAIKDAKGSAVDLSALVLGENETVYPNITYTPGTSDAPSTVTVTLPDYYSLDTTNYPVGTKTENYEIKAAENDVTNNANAMNNKITLEFPATSNTTTLSFAVVLNRSSIDDTRANAERNGTWTPNGTTAIPASTDFVATTSNGSGATATAGVAYSLNNYTGVTACFSPASERSSLSSRPLSSSYLSGLYITEHGKAENGTTPSLWVSYALPDVYSYGLVKATSVTLTAPDGFTWLDWTAATGTGVVNLSATATASISQDKRTATVSWSDDYSNATVRRVIGRFHLKADDAKWSQKNQDPTTLLPAQATYPVNATVTMGDGTKIDQKPTMTVDYTNLVGETVGFNNLPQVNGSSVLKQIAPGGGSHVLGDANDQYKHLTTLAWFENVRIPVGISGNNYDIPASDGSPTTITASFDSRIFPTDLKITGDSSASESFDPDNTATTTKSDLTHTMTTQKIGSVTYFTNKQPKGVTVDLSQQTVGTGVRSSFSLSSVMPSPLAADEHLTKVSVVYSKFAYAAASMSYLAFSTDPAVPNGTMLPITYTIDTKPAGAAEETDTKTNYIYVDGESCPSWWCGAMKTGNYYDGQYGDNADGGEGFALKVTDDFLGDVKDSSGTVQKSTGVLSTLKNPVLSMSWAYTAQFGVGYFTNGRLSMRPVMGAGWTATVTTMSAAEFKAGGNLQTGASSHSYTATNLSGGSTYDLYAAAGIPADQVIYGVKLTGPASLDIGSLSNTWDGSEHGVAVDKTLFSLGINRMAKDPLSGEFYGAQYAGGASELSDYKLGDNAAFGSKTNFANVRYDNCVESPTKHSAQDWGYFVPISQPVNLKGAELIVPSGMSTTWSSYNPTTKITMPVTQGETTTLEADVALSASTSGYPKLYSRGGEAFYFKLSQAAKENISFLDGTAEVDGKPASSSIVTIGGASYLKVVNPSNNVGEKTQTGSSFAPWKVTFDIYAQPQTPTTTLQLIEDSGSWLDLTKEGETYTYSDPASGKTYTTAIQARMLTSSQNDYYNRTGNKTIDGTFTWDWVNDSNDNCKNDPLGIYPNAGTTSLHWALPVEGYSVTPSANATSGVLMQPGLSDGTYQPSEQAVKPSQEGGLSSKILLVPGDSFDMDGLETTIAIPSRGGAVDGRTNDVSLFLTGPLAVTAGTKEGTTTPVVTYSTDGANFVAGSAITDWSAVTNVKVAVDKIAKTDAVSLVMPLRTENSGAASTAVRTGSLGSCYLSASNKYSQNGTQENIARIGTFSFSPNVVAGTVWNDTSRDGMRDAAEPGVSGATVKLYQDYATTKTLVATTTTGEDGSYRFDATTYASQDSIAYTNLSVELTLPEGTKTSTYSAQTDTLFAADKTDVAVSQRGVPATLTDDVSGVDAGIYTPVTLTYDGNDATSGAVPAAEAQLAAGETVTVLGNTGATAPQPTPLARTNYVFAGWNTSADGTGTAYAAGATFTISANTTLYAQWTENTVTISYASADAMKGSVSPVSETLGVATGVAAGSTATAAAGYHFTGWTNSLDSTTTTGATLTKAQVDAVAKRGGTYAAATFTAHFAEDQATITYASADATMGSVSPAGETLGAVTGSAGVHGHAAAGETLGAVTGSAAGSTATAAAGYHFTGWTNSLDSTTTTGATLTKAQVDAVAKRGGTYAAATFTAHFAEDADVAITYVTADSSMGSVDPGSEVVAPATGTAVGSTATANPGYHFVSWTDASGAVVSTGARLVPAKVGGLNAAATYTANFAGESKISATKSVDKTSAKPADELTYTITVTNAGTVGTAGLYVTDVIPSNTTFVSATQGGAMAQSSDGTSYVSWWIPAGVKQGESVEVSLTVTVGDCPDGTVISNTALYATSTTKPSGLLSSATGTTTNTVSTNVSNPTSPAPSTGGTPMPNQEPTASAAAPQTGDSTQALPMIAFVLAGIAVVAIGSWLRRRNV
ncbi:MAG: InlB B-repeat-containing protein [Atopobiaceae bacterium]|jgi:uncharacterized repeat protein (TIGR01451 family)/uncharacterized repeat protein (TIGR02543 family)|nr:InlB B-repeat-containing protein [Atopobiaceae bacterium]